MRAAEEAFAALLNRQPTDQERQRLIRERDALGLKDNDALWQLLVVLGHYETLYAEIPTRIAKATSHATENVKATVEAELKVAAACTRAELAKSVARTALDVAGRTGGQALDGSAGGGGGSGMGGIGGGGVGGGTLGRDAAIEAASPTAHVLLTGMSLPTVENGSAKFMFTVPTAATVSYTVRNASSAKVNVGIIPRSQWEIFGTFTVQANGNVVYAPYQAYADHQDVLCPVSDSATIPAGEYALGVACRGDCQVSADLSALY